MTFFTLRLPERRAPAEPPEWFGPPDDEVGVVLPLERDLAPTEAALVSLRSLTAYRNGFAIAAVAWRRGVEELDPWELRPTVEAGGGGPVPPDVLRFGVAFADGSKATNLDGYPGDERERAAPVLFGGPHSSLGPIAALRYWVWPVPPSEPVVLVCAWPVAGVAEVSADLSAEEIRAAAARAEPIWPPS